MGTKVKLKLHSENVYGNIHQSIRWVNAQGWAEWVVGLSYNGGNYTQVVFRMPEDMVHEIRQRNNQTNVFDDSPRA